MIYEKNAEENLKKLIFPQTKKDNFEDFWSETIDFLRSKELRISRKRLELPFDKTFITYEVQYSTHDDTVVNALYSVPNDGTGVFASTHKFLKAYPEHTDTVMDVLSYFDVNNMVSLLSVPAEFCIALSDEICYPKYVYSAYEHCNSEKELVMVPYAPHCIPYSFKMKVFGEFAKMAEEI